MPDLGQSGVWAYRCVECGTGEHLTAWAGCNAYGPLDTNGELLRHDTVEEWGVHQDSVECCEHPGAEIQRLVDGQWRRWWCCPKCDGTGDRNHTRHRWNRGNYWQCDGCEPGRRSGWLIPAEGDPASVGAEPDRTPLRGQSV